MVIKLKQSMTDGMKVMMLRDSIKRVAVERDILLFGMELGVPCILHLKNRISGKILVMILLEGLCHRPACMGVKEYFKELEIHLNNSILAEKNGNWFIPTKDDELKKVSPKNVKARKFINKLVSFLTWYLNIIMMAELEEVNFRHVWIVTPNHGET